MSRSLEYPIPVLTKDDVRVISVYVSEGKNMPITSTSIAQRFPNEPSAWKPEIEAKFKAIYDHANSWDGVKRSMSELSGILDAFADSFISYGDQAVALIKGMKGYESAGIGSLDAGQIASLPAVSIDGGDAQPFLSLTDAVKSLKAAIDSEKIKTHAILSSVDAFKLTLTNVIEPWLGAMIQASNPDNLNVEISNLRLQITQLKDTVKQSKAGSPKPSVTPLLGLELLLAPLYAAKTDISSHAGVSALSDQLKLKVESLETSVGLRGFITKLHDTMGPLYDAVTPVVNSTAQLHTHWDAVSYEIDNSVHQFTNYSLLGLFVLKMEAALNDWRNIKANSNVLRDALTDV
ncbi:MULTISPECIES: hypothetical protein [Pseudomonas]|uniref:Uncharacterized protein n=1 Tax=Pseudomonas azadiae TaxID=2843612 RepID=A0ABS6NY50_9PSED|nr:MULTISPECIES: hypothetical protein [Pseudomonas]MBV4453145.1 hypothetical protein [Pseudomonas azadiae]NMF41581.1 hypothetical protein [Pseudomonas sp. SWRI 103]